MYVKIKDNIDKDRWYSGLSGRIIEIDDHHYVDCVKSKWKIDEKHDNASVVIDSMRTIRSYFYDNTQCKVLTNLNKNKKIVPNIKYMFISPYHITALSKNEERMLKLKKIMK